MITLSFLLACLPKSSNELVEQPLSEKPPEGTADALIYDNYSISRALVVALNDAKHPNAEEDALKLVSVLERQGFSVKPILGSEASRDNILAGIEQLSLSLEDSSSRYGHSTVENGIVKPNRTLVFFAMPVEELTEIIPFEAGQGTQAEGVVQSRRGFLPIDTILDQLPESETLLLFDRPIAPLPQMGRRELPRLEHYSAYLGRKDRQVLFPQLSQAQKASDATCVAYSDAYTCNIAQGLTGSADLLEDGIISGKELALFLSDKTGQDPSLHGSVGILMKNPIKYKLSEPPPSPHDFNHISSESRAIKTMDIIYRLDQLSDRQSIGAIDGSGLINLDGKKGLNDSDFDPRLEKEALLRGAYALIDQGTMALKGSAAAKKLVAEYEKELQDRSVIVDLRGHQDPIYRLAQDAEVLVSGDANGTAILWDIPSGRLLHRFAHHRGSVLYAHVDNERNRVFLSSLDGTSSLWEMDTGNMLAELPGTGGKNTSAAVFNNHYFIGSEDGQLVHWQLNTKTQSVEAKNTLRLHKGHILSQSAAEKLLATGGRDGVVHLFELKKGELEQRRKISAEYPLVYNVELSVDGKYLLTYSSSVDRRKAKAQVWSTSTGKEVTSIRTSSGSKVKLSPRSDLVLVTTRKGEAKVYDLRGNLKREWKADKKAVIQADFSPNGSRVVTVGTDLGVKVWSSRSGRLKWEGEGLETTPYSLVFTEMENKELRIFVAGEDGIPLAWNMTEEQPIQRLSEAEIYLLRTSQKLLFTADSGGGHLIRDIDTGVQQFALKDDSNSFLQDVQFSPAEPRLATAHEDRLVRIWSTESGALIHKLEGHLDWPTKVAYSKEGDLLATGAKDGTVIIYGMASGNEILRFERLNDKEIRLLEFSSDGSRLAVVDKEGVVSLLDLVRGSILTQQISQHGAINDMHYTNDGTRLLVGHDDGALIVWKIPYGQSGNQADFSMTVERRIEAHTGPLSEIFLTPGGMRALTLGGYKGAQEAIVWNLKTEQILERYSLGGEEIQSMVLSEMGSNLMLIGQDRWKTFSLSAYGQDENWTEVPVLYYGGMLRAPRERIEELDNRIAAENPIRICLEDLKLIEINDPVLVPEAFVPLSLAPQACSGNKSQAEE